MNIKAAHFGYAVRLRGSYEKMLAAEHHKCTLWYDEAKQVLIAESTTEKKCVIHIPFTNIAFMELELGEVNSSINEDTTGAEATKGGAPKAKAKPKFSAAL